MLHYVFLTFASLETDHFSYEVPDCTSEEGCFKYLVCGRHGIDYLWHTRTGDKEANVQKYSFGL